MLELVWRHRLCRLKFYLLSNHDYLKKRVPQLRGNILRLMQRNNEISSHKYKNNKRVMVFTIKKYVDNNWQIFKNFLYKLNSTYLSTFLKLDTVMLIWSAYVARVSYEAPRPLDFVLFILWYRVDSFYYKISI